MLPQPVILVVPILGKISVPVKYSSNDEKVLDLVVVQGKRPAFQLIPLVRPAG